MRQYWTYKKISDSDLKYRLQYHNKPWYNRESAISTLMDIEKRKEIKYSKWKCIYCQLVKNSCICGKRRKVE